MDLKKVLEFLFLVFGFFVILSMPIAMALAYLFYGFLSNGFLFIIFSIIFIILISGVLAFFVSKIQNKKLLFAIKIIFAIIILITAILFIVPLFGKM